MATSQGWEGRLDPFNHGSGRVYSRVGIPYCCFGWSGKTGLAEFPGLDAKDRCAGAQAAQRLNVCENGVTPVARVTGFRHRSECELVCAGQIGVIRFAIPGMTRPRPGSLEVGFVAVDVPSACTSTRIH